MPESPVADIAPEIKGILHRIKGSADSLESATEAESLIEVNALTSRAGTLYEKIRYLLDYKEDHAIRRAAVARILRRQIIIERSTDIGLSLLLELIAAGYLPNKRIPERAAGSVQAIVDPYLALRAKVRRVPKSDALIINFAASELCAFLYPNAVEEPLIEAAYGRIRERIKTNYAVPPEDLDLAIYIACRRSILREDNDALSYALWRRFSRWSPGLSPEDIALLAEDFGAIAGRIGRGLTMRLAWDLVPKLKNQSIYYSVLKEIIGRYGVETETIMKDQAYFEQTIRAVLNEHYKKESSKTVRSAFRAIVYIFCTKLVLGVLLELPYDYYVLKSFNYVPLVANILFHPTMLFFMTRIGKLGDENTALVISGLTKIVHGTEQKPILIRKDFGALNALFSVLYLGLFMLSFGILIGILLEAAFNPVSIILFLFFLTLAAYFGLRIRHNAERWRVKTGDESARSLLWGVFTLPIVKAGRFLTRTFSAVNVFVFTMDFIIEAPFKLVLAVADSFTSFLREKREEAL